MPSDVDLADLHDRLDSVANELGIVIFVGVIRINATDQREE